MSEASFNPELLNTFRKTVDSRIRSTAEALGVDPALVVRETPNKAVFGTFAALNDDGYDVTVSAGYAPAEFINLTVGPDHRPGLTFEFGSSCLDEAMTICRLLREGMLDVTVNSAPI
jgi:hypothetical protein